MLRLHEVGDRDAVHAGDLGGCRHADRRRLGPPREDRGHDEVAHRQVQVRQGAEGQDTRRIDVGLLLRFPQGGRDRIGVLRIEGPAGERGLTRMGAHVGCALDDEQVRTVVAEAEADEDRGMPLVLRGRQESGELLGARRAGHRDDGREEVGQRRHRVLEDLAEPVPGHARPSVRTSFSAASGSVGPSP